jgi:two-component system, OmpR family, response regulator
LDGVRAEQRRDELGPVLRVGPIELDAATYEVRLDGRRLAIPLREFELLRYLMDRADRVVTRDDIARDVWNRAGPITTNTINVHVKRLRKRLGDGQARPSLIRTVRGVGFRLVHPD